jgi:hypothetical protein
MSKHRVLSFEPQPVQLALAAGTGLVVDIDDDLDPRQVRRQRATVAASLAAVCSIFGKGLGLAAKTVPLQFLDDLAQPLILHPLGEQHRFQRLEIVGQCVAWHDRIRSYSATFCDGG